MISSNIFHILKVHSQRVGPRSALSRILEFYREVTNTAEHACVCGLRQRKLVIEGHSLLKCEYLLRTVIYSFQL